MAGFLRETPTTVSGVIFGGFGIILLALALFAGIILVSIIPVYLPDSSVPGYGEIYRIPGLTIKAVFKNVSVNFTGGNVVDLQQLSTICTNIFRAKNVRDFYACVASNFTTYGMTGNINATSVTRRRRDFNDVALYEIGDLFILFSNTCNNQRALGRWFSRLTSRQNSSCVAQRATACQQFVTNPNTGIGGNQWLPFPTGYTQLITTNLTACAGISISSIYNLPTTLYGGLAYNYNVTRPLDFVPGGAQYYSIVPQSTLQSMVSNSSGLAVNPCLYYVG